MLEKKIIDNEVIYQLIEEVDYSVLDDVELLITKYTKNSN